MISITLLHIIMMIMTVMMMRSVLLLLVISSALLHYFIKIFDDYLKENPPTVSLDE